MLAGIITVPRSKNGHTRRVPMNSRARALLLDLGAARRRPDDPSEPVFPCRHAQADKFFPKAVEQAQMALKAAGKDASGLDGYTWHCNRHTFTSRLVMAGVDLRSVQDLGGWRSLAMVQRYAHLAPEHLHEAVERLVRVESAKSDGTSA
jgi:site-specific recombinase XerD